MLTLYGGARFGQGLPPKWTGLENFRTLIADPPFLKSLLNSVKYLVIVPVLQLASLAVAVLALGVIGSLDAAREAGAVAARGLIELGLNWNFAPSLDVNVNPLNPVIGERAFGSDPAEVARLGVAWAQGSEDAGVMSAVKHFPGHGDMALDSHLSLPTVDKPRGELEQLEWWPFRAAVWANLGSIMTAHIVYPALDPHEPATLSRPVLTGLLRETWRYRGVIVTDATDMRAIADLYLHGEAAPLALAAGADAVLSCGHGDLTPHAEHAATLERALREGRLSAQRLSEAQERIRAAAERFPGAPRAYTGSQRAADNLRTLEWARRSLQWMGTPPRLDPKRPVLLFWALTAQVGGPYGDFLGGEALAASLRTVFPQLWAASQDEDPQPALELLARFPEAPVLLATTGRWAGRCRTHCAASLQRWEPTRAASGALEPRACGGHLAARRDHARLPARQPAGAL